MAFGAEATSTEISKKEADILKLQNIMLEMLPMSRSKLVKPELSNYDKDAIKLMKDFPYILKLKILDPQKTQTKIKTDLEGALDVMKEKLLEKKDEIRKKSYGPNCELPNAETVICTYEGITATYRKEEGPASPSPRLPAIKGVPAVVVSHL